DGGDTAPLEAPARSAIDAPVMTVGIGSPQLTRDREVVNLTAGEPLLPGASVHTVFTVSPDPDVSTVYAVRIPDASGEIALENNTRSVLVPPQTARRKILI